VGKVRIIDVQKEANLPVATWHATPSCHRLVSASPAHEKPSEDRLGRRGGFLRAALSVATLFSSVMVVLSGCSKIDTEYVRFYYFAPKPETIPVNRSAIPIGIVPFQDCRTDGLLYRYYWFTYELENGEDPGIWVANALRLEFQLRGVPVYALPKDHTPTSGRVVTGQINGLVSQGVTWWITPIPPVYSTEYRPAISFSVSYYEDGVPILSRQYSIKNSESHMYAGDAHPDPFIAISFANALAKLLREQVLPDLEQAMRDAPAAPQMPQESQ
jgi:hypothetical protein